MIKRTEALELFKNQQWDKLLPLFPKLDNLLGVSQKDFIGVGNVYMHREVMKNNSPVYDIWDNTRCAHTYGPAIHGYEHRAIDLMCNPYSFYLKEGCVIRNPFPEGWTVQAWNIRNDEEDHISVCTGGGSGNQLSLTAYLYPEDAKTGDTLFSITVSYYHLKKGGVLVKDGQLVGHNQPVALVGGSGFSSVPAYEEIPQKGHGGFHTHVSIGLLSGVAGYDDPFTLPVSIFDSNMLKSNLIGACNTNHAMHDGKIGRYCAWINKDMCVTAHPGSKMVYDIETAENAPMIRNIFHDANPWGTFQPVSLLGCTTFTQFGTRRWRFEHTHDNKWWLGDKRYGLYRYYAVYSNGNRSNNFYICLCPKG